jgi:hypothetical protein
MAAMTDLFTGRKISRATFGPKSGNIISQNKPQFNPGIEGAGISAVLAGMKDQRTGLSMLEKIYREAQDNPAYAVDPITGTALFATATFGVGPVAKLATKGIPKVITAGVESLKSSDTATSFAEAISKGGEKAVDVLKPVACAVQPYIEMAGRSVPVNALASIPSKVEPYRYLAAKPNPYLDAAASRVQQLSTQMQVRPVFRGQLPTAKACRLVTASRCRHYRLSDIEERESLSRATIERLVDIGVRNLPGDSVVIVFAGSRAQSATWSMTRTVFLYISPNIIAVVVKSQMLSHQTFPAIV